MRRVTPLQAALWLMAAEAASLAVISAAHLASGHTASGIPEAVICVVLAAGAIVLWRNPQDARRLAQAAVGFAIAGFLVGLASTISSGSAIEVAYHVTALPLLVATLFALHLGRPAARRAD